IHHARRAVAMDGLREEAHYRLLRLLIEAGQPAEALRHYRELENRFGSELKRHPSLATAAIAREAERELAAEVLVASSSADESVIPTRGPVHASTAGLPFVEDREFATAFAEITTG